MHEFLIHNEGDDVGVVIRDIDEGEVLTGVFMDTGGQVEVTARGAIPLSHKVAVHGLDEGDEVVEYGVRIGTATAPIAAGDYVHTHNIRSARWGDLTERGKANAGPDSNRSDE